MSTSLFGNRRFLLGAFALSALAFFATANVRDGGALLGQAAPTYVPAIHAYTKAQCEKGVVIKANDHNQVRCEGTGAFPAFSGPLGNNEQIRFWGYEFTGDEPPFHGNFRISAGELKVNPKYQVINKLGNLRRGKAYYFMTEKDLFFRCGEGLSYVQACGNGVLEGNEQCDDGNIVDGDGCSKTCTIETVERVCGNGIVEPGEECDDGNMQNGDGCSRTCTIEKVCGNGIVEEGEECDDGNQNNTDGCTTACRLPVCGDGYVQAGEACDDGNTEDGDGCSANCTVETIEDPEPEPVCGNGIVEEGEECDDGNFSDDDACTQNCTFTPCTDSDGSDIYTKGTTSGIRQGRLVRHTDSCFNRNMVLEGYCRADPITGRMQLETGTEFCEDGCLDGACVSGSLIPPAPVCGNGKVETGEECDDGNTQDGDGCSSVCKKEAVEGWNLQRTFEASSGKKFSAEQPAPAGGQYTLLLAGDFDRDQRVSAGDLGFLAAKYGSVRGDTLYDQEYDLNFDGSINSLDHKIFSQNFGKRFPQQATLTQGKTAVRMEWTPTTNDAGATHHFILVGIIQNQKHTVVLSISVAPGIVPEPPRCGDGICTPEEAMIICAQCLPGTPCITGCRAACPADCESGGPVCGNGVCEGDSEKLNCPQDCPAMPKCAENGQKVYVNEAFGPTACCSKNAGVKPNSSMVGGGVCVSTADGAKGTCVDGWWKTCGDRICGQGEDYCNCPADCKTPVPEFCVSSAECPQNMFCTTETGDCNSYPCEPGKFCLTVCTGKCVPRDDVPQEQCGNGTVEAGEECDDGNTKDGDGCSKACLKEFCGDAIVQKALGEQCDNGAVCSHDTSLSCRTSSDCNRCELIPGTSVKRCGRNPYALICKSDADCAAQDTQNTCRYHTELDPGCPETCRQVQVTCGNEKIEGKEKCDDGNTQDDDGCSSTCNIEDGWQCFGEPSQCKILIPTLSLPTSAPVTLHSISLQGDMLLITYSKDFDTCAILETSRGFMEASKQYLCRRGSKIQVYIPLTSATSAFVQPNSTARLCHSEKMDVCSTSLYINTPPFARIISAFSRVTSALASLLFIL